jgi:hypothetical protein
MCECKHIELSLKLSRIDQHKIQSQNHGELSPKSEDLVNVIVSIWKKLPQFLSNVSKKITKDVEEDRQGILSTEE